MKTPLRFAILGFSCRLQRLRKSREAWGFGSEVKVLGCPRIREQVCKPNSVHREPRTIHGWAIIPLGRTLPDGSSDLPGGVARPEGARVRTGRPLPASLFGLA